jgi:S-(hydroxymethyl)glutathione dehydrogenase/alcohol dehydrogenase
MSTKAKAVITSGDGSCWIDEITLDDPGPGEVLVRIMAAGVCHTDYDHQSWKQNLILGHEGAGLVEAAGKGSSFREGNRVLLNWAIPCGNCFQCRRGAENICEQKPAVSAAHYHHASLAISPMFHLGTMAEFALVPEQALTRINVQIPFASAAILGCGVMTGFGSVVNVAKVAPGTSVVVLGTGGVGLNVIQGARFAKAGMIIGVDVNPDRLEYARQFGATHVIQTEKDDAGLLKAAQEVYKLTERGADYAFECTAVPKLGSAPLAMVRNGGTAVGVSGIEEVIPIDMKLFEWDKIYINPLYGQCRPSIDLPLLLQLYASGDIKLDSMVTRTYPLSSIHEAFEDMKAGLNAKGVLLPHGL